MIDRESAAARPGAWRENGAKTVGFEPAKSLN